MRVTVTIHGRQPYDAVIARSRGTELRAVRINGNRLQLLTDQCVYDEHTNDLAACWSALVDYARVTDTPAIEGWDEVDNHVTYDLIGTGG